MPLKTGLTLEAAWTEATTLLSEFGISSSKVVILNFGREKFQLLKDLVNEIPWEIVLTYKGTNWSWQLFRATFLRVEELSMSVCRKSGKAGWKLAGKVLLSLRRKKGMQNS